MGMVGHPLEHNFEVIVRDNMITNLTFTEKDTTNAYRIFGPDLSY